MFENFHIRPVANNAELKARVAACTQVIDSFADPTTGATVLFSGMSVEHAHEIGVR